MKLRRSLLASTAATTLIATAIATPLAHAESSQKPLVVEQGDTTVLGYVLGETCTIAYNDHTNNVSYLAGHCGGQDGPTKISLKDPRGDTEAYVDVGYFFPGVDSDWQNGETNDWGYIRWNSNVTLGPNVITGDEKIDPRTLTYGDKVCRFGQASFKDKSQSSCGTFQDYNSTYDYFVYTSEIMSKKGDSGGPVWLERDGRRYFLGPHSGPSYFINTVEKRQGLRGGIIDYDFRHPADTGNVDNQTSSTTSSTGSSYDVINSSQENGEEISSYTASQVWLYIAALSLSAALTALIEIFL